MSKKYIQEYQNKNFVYPNNDPWEYGVEIIHNINNNSVSGEVTGFDADIVSGNVYLSFTYQWFLNNADRFYLSNGDVSILSLHMMDNVNTYYKPWRLVGTVTSNNPNITYKTDTVIFTVTPAMMDVASFSNGTYFFEVKMIGLKEVFPICIETTVTGATPSTPTPTPTPSHTPTHTPTPTPTTTSGLTPTPTPTHTPTPSPSGGGTYNYYMVDKYNCPGCTINTTNLVARVSSPTTLTDTYYYNNGDGFVYLCNYEIAYTTYDVDLDGSASAGTNCPGTCAI